MFKFQKWFVSKKVYSILKKVLIISIISVLILGIFIIQEKRKNIIPKAQASGAVLFEVGGGFTQGEIINPGFYIVGAEAKGKYLYVWGNNRLLFYEIKKTGGKMIFDLKATRQLLFGVQPFDVQGGKIFGQGEALILWDFGQRILFYSLKNNWPDNKLEFTNTTNPYGATSLGADRVIIWGGGEVKIYKYQIANVVFEKNFTYDGYISQIEVGVKQNIFALVSELDGNRQRLVNIDGQAMPYNILFEETYQFPGKEYDYISLIKDRLLMVSESRRFACSGCGQFKLYDISSKIWTEYNNDNLNSPGLLLYSADQAFGVGGDYLIRTGDDPYGPNWPVEGWTGSDMQSLYYGSPLGVKSLVSGGREYIDLHPSTRVPRIVGAKTISDSRFVLWMYGKKMVFYNIDRAKPQDQQVKREKLLDGYDPATLDIIPFELNILVPIQYKAGSWAVAAFAGAATVPIALRPRLQKSDFQEPAGTYRYDEYDFGGVIGIPDHNENTLGLSSDKTVEYSVKFDNVRARQQLDVILALDSTGSMKEGNPSKLTFAKDALKYFIDFMDFGLDRVSVLEFNSYILKEKPAGNICNGEVDPIWKLKYARGMATFGTNAASVKNFVDSIVIPQGETPLGAPILMANKMMEREGRPAGAAKRIMILLSDGKHNYDPSLEDLPPFCWDNTYKYSWIPIINASIKEQMTIYTVGVADEAGLIDEAYLYDKISRPTGGGRPYVGKGTDLRQFYQKIYEQIIGGIKDTIPPGTNLVDVELSGVKHRWTGVNFNPPMPAGVLMSFNPATRVLYWANPPNTGGYKIHVKVPKNWLALPTTPDNQVLVNEIECGESHNYDHTQVLSTGIQAIGDVFIPGIGGFGADVTISPGGVTFKGDWVLDDYHFRRKSSSDWQQVRTQTQKNWAALLPEAQTHQFDPNVNFADLSPPDNPQGLWFANGLSINNPATNITGNGTILVQGDLNISQNLSYNAVGSNVLGFIVTGNVNVEGNVTHIDGNFLVLGVPGFNVAQPNPPNAQLVVVGLTVAENFTFNRDIATKDPSVIFVYDGKVVIDPPAGFKTILSPVWTEINA